MPDHTAAAAAAASLDAAYARAEATENARATEARLALFNVVDAIWIGRDDHGYYVHLTVDPAGDGYLLHAVADTETYCATVECRPIRRQNARILRAKLREACDYYADLVAEQGLRRPGTTRLAKAINEIVEDAIADRADLDAEAAAATEQSLTYFNRYVAGDR